MKKAELILIIIAVIIFGGILYVVWQRPVPPAGSAENIITNVGLGAFPEQFPRDVPIEAGAVLVKNVHATFPDGRVQATRAFESTMSAAFNFAYYKKYVTDAGHGWIFLNEVNVASDPDHTAIFAKNVDGILSINISAETSSGASLVDLSFVTAYPVK